MFIDEITDVLADIVPKYHNLVILGDFNISTEKETSPDTVIFNDTMAALGLQQHVQGPTHKMGNTLDLIFSQLETQLTVAGTTTHGFVSDHCMVSVELSLKKPIPPIVRKVIRDCSKITPQSFAENYTNPNYDENTTLEEAHNLFQEEQGGTTEDHQVHQQTETPMTQSIHKRTEESSQKQRENMETIQAGAPVVGLYKGKEHIQ